MSPTNKEALEGFFIISFQEWATENGVEAFSIDPFEIAKWVGAKFSNSPTASKLAAFEHILATNKFIRSAEGTKALKEFFGVKD